MTEKSAEVLGVEAELKKYETEIDAVNKRLAEIDEARTNVLRHGMRIEGIVAYLKSKITQLQVPDKKEEPAAV